MERFDFSGWATRNDLKCSDGRTIRKDAFKDNNGQKVPLVWNHQHNDPLNILGHALLENRQEGVYAYCTFNETEAGQNAKLLVEHGDVSALSIYANQLKQRGSDVIHGAIREVSLVLAGANPGAFIDSVICHGEESDEEAIIYTGEDISLFHAECAKKEETKEEKPVENEKKTAESEKKTTDSEETIGEVFDTLNEKQKTAVFALIAQALENADNSNDDDEEEKEMKHNVFDQDETMKENVLSHSDIESILSDAKRSGSLKESFLAHTATYGIDQIDTLFPEPKSMNTPPEFIKRDMDWVAGVINGVHHTPFSRIKSMFANITEDEARAKGYIKGNLKKEEVFTLLKRTTTPTTIYKKQKLDRDDILDITDFDVVAWIKGEMRMMLDEEIARAILVGDGRLTSDDDHIPEQNIRPVWKDDDLYTIKTKITVSTTATDDDKAKAMIKAAVKSRKNYKGSGNPVLYTTEDFLTNCLLLEDTQGYRLYKSEQDVATAMRVSKIVTVPVMEGLTRTDSESKTRTLMGIIVNLKDYNVGADKGGAVNMFDDFDIDYNQQKYLMETRCSGALIKPYSAIALEMVTE